jgi:type III restriction enzyme
VTLPIYDADLVESVAETLLLREPNKQALDAVARLLGEAPEGVEMVADLATGVGKTYVAAGLLDYLQASGVRNVAIITPGSTVFDKTVNNFTPGHPKFVQGLACEPTVITLDDFERGQVAQAMADPEAFKVFIFTVQSLLTGTERNPDSRRVHRPHEVLGEALYDYLQGCDDLVVIADEHHQYFAKKFSKAVRELAPAALVGLTATPHDDTPPEQVVYHYPLVDAIADGYVKIPVLVARQDGAADERTQLADALILLDVKRSALKAHADRQRQPAVNPVLFVVASSIDEANRISDILAGADMFNDPAAVLTITSDSVEDDLAQLDAVERPDSPVRAIISVQMLKEGWDVKNIYVILAVRALESKVLTEQILGRGLRLPFGTRTGIPMLDTVEVLSHHKFRDLLAQADALLGQTIGERKVDATITAVTQVGTAGETVVEPGQSAGTDLAQLGERVEQADGEFVVTLPGDGQDGERTAAMFTTVRARVTQARDELAAISTPLQPRTPNGLRLPLHIPTIITTREREPFTLTAIHELDVEARGRAFADDNAPTLRRKALDAKRGDDGVNVNVHELDESIAAADLEARLPFDSIEADLTQKILSSNLAPARGMDEANAATALARAFLRGADVTPETPWRPEHGRLAAAALVEFLKSEAATTTKVTEVVKVQLAAWPEPAARDQSKPSVIRTLVTDSRGFVRSQPYTGWDKSIYDAVAFDSYSAEFALAELLDDDPAIKAWTRLDRSVPLSMPYREGGRIRDYFPDFLALTTDGTVWILEGKADDQITSENVLAKRDAAHRWLQTVNNAPNVHDKWAYMLASESAIKNARGSWANLRAAAQTYP